MANNPNYVPGPPIPKYELPAFRRLRVYSVDPAMALKVDTLDIAIATLNIRRESLQPGPIGEYLEVIDYDPASGCFYVPIDLEVPALLETCGLDPTESDPRFHQQMTYAVAMNTIQYFENALGRRVLWSSKWSPHGQKTESQRREEQMVRRLRIYPHALRGGNAYYDPSKRALLFGYFRSGADSGEANVEGGLVFTCLSFDIITHETTHAILDGMHRRFLEDTNPDVLAFHEAFADIVALFQHFTLQELVEHAIGVSRGDLETGNVLAQLAIQFGDALGKHGALRDAIGRIEDLPDGTKHWIRATPKERDIRKAIEPHDRGGILVSAVFDAFLEIYKARIADLMRIGSNGSGILRPGALHPDLVGRLAAEASKVARHVMTMCIRALDYCPPIDITFGEYLRAIVTSDADAVPDDKLGYRNAFVYAFRKWGIYPPNVPALGIDSLLWQPLGGQLEFDTIKTVLGSWLDEWHSLVTEQVSRYNRHGSREDIHRWSGDTCVLINHKVKELTEKYPKLAEDLFGITVRPVQAPEDAYKIEVHAARMAWREPVEGEIAPATDLVLIINQQTYIHPQDPQRDIKRQQDIAGALQFRGGATVIYNVDKREFRYVIRKNINSPTRRMQYRDYVNNRYDVENLYSPSKASPFKILHGNGVWS
jgi:hypothetical protein